MYLSIFSWNIGNNVKQNIFENVYKNIKIYGKSDILVFGFQEVPVNKFQDLTSILDNISKKLGFNNSFEEITTQWTCK